MSLKSTAPLQTPQPNPNVAYRLDICCIRSYAPQIPSDLILNDLVHRYLADTAFSITKTPSGKPIVTNTHHPLSISLSHTGTFLCIAIANTPSIGIDIELIDRCIHHPTRVVKRCFSPSHYREYMADSTTSQPRRFQTGWTKFEAYVKCHGSGVFHPIPDCDHLWDLRPSYTTDTTLWPISIHPQLASCIAYPHISGPTPPQFKLIHTQLTQQALPHSLPIIPFRIR